METYLQVRTFLSRTERTFINYYFRGSTDGLNATAFHAHCDNKGETFIIILSTKVYLFGGYTNTNWTSPTYSQSTNAFLFSLMSSQKFPATKFPINLRYRNYAIVNDVLSEPIFGVMDQPDIGIYDLNNQFRCQIHFPSVYKGDIDGSGFPFSNDCMINEIEVFIPVFKESSLFLYYVFDTFKNILSLVVTFIMIVSYDRIGYFDNKKSDIRCICHVLILPISSLD
jgi:hypothetical protein